MVRTNKNDYLFTEKAIRSKIGNNWVQFFNVLENPDSVLQKTGYGIEILDEIKSDPQVFSCVSSRTAAVQKMKWKLEQAKASTKAIEIILKIFDKFKMHSIINEIMDGIFYGYSVQEVVWAPIDGYIVPVKIEQKPHEWFSFDNDNNLMRLKDKINNYVKAEERKFLLSQNNPSYKNPYGEGLLSKCFWPVTFKKGGIKFWAIFLEKFGMPQIYGKLPADATGEQKDGLLSTLHNMIRDAVTVIPDNGSISFLETNVSASTDCFESFTKYYDGQISKVILGHSAASDSTSGKLGGENIAMEVKESLTKSDALLICETINELIRWILHFNPTLGIEPPNFVLYQKDNIDKTLAERDQILASTGNIKFSKDYFKRVYGFSDSDIIL